MKHLITIMTVLYTAMTLQAGVKLVQTKSRSATAVVHYKIDNFKIDPVVEEGKRYSKIVVDGIENILNKKGTPELPVTAVDVMIHGDENASVRIDSIRYRTISVLPVLPAKGSFTRNIKPSSVKRIEGEIYSQDSWYPESAVQGSAPFQLRDVHGLSIRIAPFSYNGVRRELRIAEEIFVTVIEDSDGPSVRSAASHSSQEFEEIYQNRFLNYHSSQTRAQHVQDGEKMIVIAPEKYQEAIKPFLDWKNQKGIQTTLHLYPKETGSDTASIRKFITEKYNSDKITYVTLIGDAEDIPAPLIWVDDKQMVPELDSLVPADPLYGMVAGNDLYADLFVGRIPAGSSEEVTVIVNKIISYEKSPEVGAAWYQKAISIGSSEGEPKDSDWMKDSINPVLKNYGFNNVDIIAEGDGKSTGDISRAVNEGRSVLNFMGHGDYAGFGFSSGLWYDTTMIRNLTNGQKLPVIIPLACNYGMYKDREGPAEYWLQNPEGGAIAVVASTPLMAWMEPQIAQVEMNRLFAREAHSSFGAYFYNGQMKMLDYSTEGESKRTAQTWVYFGDPSLQLFTKSPAELDVSFPETVSPDRGAVSVNGEDGALVTLYNKSTGKVVRGTISGGSVSLTAAVAKGDNVILTATKRNRVPSMITVTAGESTALHSQVQSVTKLSIGGMTNGKLQLIVPKAGVYSVKLYSLNGALLSNQSAHMSIGINSIDLSRNSFARSMVLLNISGEGSQVMKKLLLK